MRRALIWINKGDEMKINQGNKIPDGAETLPPELQAAQQAAQQPPEPQASLSPEEKIFIEISATFIQSLDKIEECKEGLKYLSCFLQAPEVYESSLNNDVKFVLDEINKEEGSLSHLRGSISDLHTRFHKKIQRNLKSDKYKMIGKLLK